jgi:hypothetical protein
MSLSEESNDYYSERRRHFDLLKKNTPVGIFGSFYGSRKTDLRALQRFLQKDGYFPRLSEDLEEETGDEENIRDPVRNRGLSPEDQTSLLKQIANAEDQRKTSYIISVPGCYYEIEFGLLKGGGKGGE